MLFFFALECSSLLVAYCVHCNVGNQWSNLGDQKATKEVDHCVVFLVILVGVCVYSSVWDLVRNQDPIARYTSVMFGV